MPLPQSVRSLLPLIIGLAVGGAGATLFLESMPGAEGSPQERANKLELELKHALNRIAALEAEQNSPSKANGVIQRLASGNARRTLKDGAREIAEDLREGRPVTPEDIFRASQPLMRDLAPLFDRMRVRQQKQVIDSLTGELARKYDLNPAQQDQLRQWFERKSEEDAKRWSNMVGSEGTRLEDIMRASRDVRPDEGLDAMMPHVLTGEKLAQFQNERLTERAQRVERDADMKVQRLNSVVGLDEGQRDQIFGIMARNSPQYDPKMAIDGINGPVNAAATSNPQEAMMSVLRPDQRAAYEAERQRRREAAAKDMEAIGLSLPPDWSMFEDDW